jgi:predicted nucleic acid-binding protein
MRNVLLDSGAIIALFAPDDRHHAHFRPLLTQFAAEGLRLVTTWPCVVEATHILKPLQRFEMLQWIELGGAAVYPFEARHLGDMRRWMRRYTETDKREMDFADASLYWLAAESGITEIMTVDVNDFSRYRLPDGYAFVLL